MTQRVSNAVQSPIFNSVSNLAYSQYSSQNYGTSLGNFGAFSANFSSNNTNFGVDPHNPLNNSRFGDMTSVSSYAMNGYGVIYDQSSTQTKLSNIAYSGSMFGVNFISRILIFKQEWTWIKFKTTTQCKLLPSTTAHFFRSFPIKVMPRRSKFHTTLEITENSQSQQRLEQIHLTKMP